jgi:hypothetical protein
MSFEIVRLLSVNVTLNIQKAKAVNMANFELLQVTAKDTGGYDITIRNLMTLTEKILSINGNVLEYCKLFNIDYSKYIRDVYDSLGDELPDKWQADILGNIKTYDKIPTYQLYYNDDKITDFTYNICVLLDYIKNYGRYRTDIKSKLKNKISIKQHQKTLYRQYLQIKRKYFIPEYYKQLPILNRLNRYMYEYILKYSY